jgi:hypothetical protein
MHCFSFIANLTPNPFPLGKGNRRRKHNDDSSFFDSYSPSLKERGWGLGFRRGQG